MAERVLGMAVPALGTLSAVRGWLFGLVVSAALVLPAAALAGTYSWPLPTSQAPGAANPDHDAYGATPWSYLEAQTVTSPGPSSGGPAYSGLGAYSTAIDGALTGWYDPSDRDAPYVAANRTDGPVGVVAPGTLAIQPAADRLVAVGWTSPLPDTEKVTVSGSITADDPSPMCLSRPTWALEQGSSVLAAGGLPPGGGAQAISASADVGSGQSVVLVVGWTGGSFDSACVTAGLSLDIAAPSTVPVVSLDQPAPGEHIDNAQPTFAGHATTAFGDSPLVAVRVFRGRSTAGSLAEHFDVRSAGGSFSAPAEPPLPNGVYTVVAEQPDAAGDVGASRPVTFWLHNVAPVLVLRALPSRLLTPTPTISGTAGTRSGDGESVTVGVWKGRVAGGPPMRYLVAKRGSGGAFSVRISPPLANGVYTAVAAQAGPGATYGVSKPVSFRIDAPALDPIGPRVTLSGSGQAGLSVSCPAVTGSCSGDVLVLTSRPYAPVPGGPRGALRVLFAHVEVPARATRAVWRPLPAYLAAFLRHRVPLGVRVSVAFTDSSGHAVSRSATRTLLASAAGP